jgi:hypothetical protein
MFLFLTHIRTIVAAAISTPRDQELSRREVSSGVFAGLIVGSLGILAVLCVVWYQYVVRYTNWPGSPRT